ncbi:MAG TPA: transcription elongation factor GreA [Patescibacteria group bacterium]|nr:transcription elongation factor GreA [Patescibacteria group bacterium]
MQNKPVQLTEKAFGDLQKELKELTDVKRPKLVERLSHAMAEGDLAENSDYHNAKEELEFLDGRIDELSVVVNNAVITNDNAKQTGKVGMGTRVTVKIGGKEQTFTIVGEWEADAANKKISPSSPLGQMLMDKSKGEKIEVEAPAGKVMYEIVEIE